MSLIQLFKTSWKNLCGLGFFFFPLHFLNNGLALAISSWNQLTVMTLSAFLVNLSEAWWPRKRQKCSLGGSKERVHRGWTSNILNADEVAATQFQCWWLTYKAARLWRERECATSPHMKVSVSSSPLSVLVISLTSLIQPRNDDKYLRRPLAQKFPLPGWGSE